MVEKTTRLLILDDSGVVVKRLKSALREALPQAEILVAYKGADGLKTVDDQKPDLVLLDLQLPDINGIDILKVIKHKHPTTAVIVLSNNSEKHNRLACIKGGAEGFYDKSTEFEKAIEHIISIEL